MTLAKRCIGLGLALCVALAGGLSGGFVHAGGAAGGGSTEITQIMNNFELVASVAKQASMVEQQIQSNINLINQYKKSLQNLSTLSPQSLSSALAAYNNQINSFEYVKRSVSSLQRAAQKTYDMASARTSEARSMDMDMGTYLKNEVALANTRGAGYKQRLDQDVATMDNLAARAANLQQVSAETASVTGNLQGLQNLGQISAITAGELMEIKAAILAQNLDRTTDQRQLEAAGADNTNAARQGAAVSAQRKQRNAATTLDATTPWSNY
jgi:hypothetical protein